jgi:hypothetical protein
MAGNPNPRGIYYNRSYANGESRNGEERSTNELQFSSEMCLSVDNAQQLQWKEMSVPYY